MFEFVKKWFFTGLAFLSTLTSVNSLSCISINNQECEVRPQIVNVNNILLVLKQAKALVVAIMSKMCVPDVAKNWNVKAFNLMSRSNETRHIKWQETCKCKCRLDASVSNNKQRWNNDKCWCGCKELIDKGVCDKGFIWNPSNCECEYDQSRDVGVYLDYKNCKCRKKLFDQIVAECTETVEEVKIAEN